MSVILTPKAVLAVKRFRADDGHGEDARLRVRVIPGGCSGLNYKLDFEAQPPGPGDKQLEFDGLQVVIDPKSMLFLNGIVIDYKDGLSGSGFSFQNPNAKETCNCGESFKA